MSICPNFDKDLSAAPSNPSNLALSTQARRWLLWSGLLLVFLSACGPFELSTAPPLDDFQDDAPANNDAGEASCEAFCSANTLDLINDCFIDPQEPPVDTSECQEICAEEGFAPATTCLLGAVDDCQAAAECLELDDDGDFEPVSFEVVGTDAIMRGVIDRRTIAAVDDLLANHPQVERIVLLDCPGSADDVSNLTAARKIRAAGLSTHVPADGFIASGAVDFFTAGVERTAEVAQGARLGVHSWGGSGGISGADVPEDDPSHQLYLDYYQEMGIPEDFYWFTLDAAGPDDIHIMTADEVARYGLTTQ